MAPLSLCHRRTWHTSVCPWTTSWSYQCAVEVRGVAVSLVTTPAITVAPLTSQPSLLTPHNPFLVQCCVLLCCALRSNPWMHGTGIAQRAMGSGRSRPHQVRPAPLLRALGLVWCAIWPHTSTSGYYDVTVATWRPLGQTLIDELRRVFIGGGPQLEDVVSVGVKSDVTGPAPAAKYGLRSQSSGSLHLRLSVAHQSR